MHDFTQIEPVCDLEPNAAQAPEDKRQETLALLKILALGNHLVERGKVVPVAEVVKRLRGQ